LARPHSRRLAAWALALAAALAATACTATPSGSGPGGSASSSPGITAAAARQVWDHYVAVSSAQTIKTGNFALALALETGPQRAYDAATHPSLLAPPAYQSPTFYLPERSGYPRFFVVAVTQKLTSGSPATAAAPASVDGAEIHPFGPELMLFEQARAGASWLLGSTAKLAVGEALPKLATDSAGYIPPMTPTAATLLAQPGEVGALQAAVVDDGPASTATAAMADGQLTDGLYHGALSHAAGLTAPHGDVYQWELKGTSYPEFALRTAAGGALVFYAMTLDTTVAVPDYINKADPVRPGAPIQVPIEVERLLPSGQPAPRIDLQSEQLLSFAAIDPAAAGGKVQVIAMGGGLTSATAS
jgi:hypothetical protein